MTSTLTRCPIDPLLRLICVIGFAYLNPSHPTFNSRQHISECSISSYRPVVTPLERCVNLPGSILVSIILFIDFTEAPAAIFIDRGDRCREMVGGGPVSNPRRAAHACHCKIADLKTVRNCGHVAFTRRIVGDRVHFWGMTGNLRFGKRGVFVNITVTQKGALADTENVTNLSLL